VIEKLSILNKKSRKVVDILYVTLLLKSKYTHLPELYNIFGKDKLCDFLDIFAGATVEVPSRKDFLEAIRDASIYFEVKSLRRSVNSDAYKALIKKIANECDLTEKKVLSIIKSVDKCVVESGLEVL
jgi:hypothetical protein